MDSVTISHSGESCFYLLNPLSKISYKLDWESIRSSPRDGSSTSNGLTKGWLGFGGWLGVVGWVVGPQYFCVIPWHFENSASSRLMMFLLKMMDYSMYFLLLST